MTYRTRQSDNTHQWFVEESGNETSYKIIQVLYSKEAADTYITTKLLAKASRTVTYTIH